MGGEFLRSSATLEFGLRQLELNAVDAVHAIDEEDQDEDEGDLQAVLEFCYYGRFGDEGEQAALDGEGQRDDEGHEDHHLEHEECEHLGGVLVGILKGGLGY